MSPSLDINETMTKFGYPDTLIAQYDHWVILLRPKQVTLGSLVLACTQPATAFADVSATAFAELKRVVGDLERVLAHEFSFDKINYLMLKMVDPHVHFHVLPRYATRRTFAETTFADPAWPGPPDITHCEQLDDATSKRLLKRLREAWS